jgi:ATP-dependent exoDNAse (exonuclease V) beta subunit
LKRRGIRFRAVEQDLLGERPAVRDLLALTRALLHPADRAAWLAILRAPWCGLTLADLQRAANSNPDTPVWETICNPDFEVNEPGRLECFRRAMSIAVSRVRRVPVRECVELAWEALHGPACLESAASRSDARRFLDLIEDLDQGGEIADLDLLERRVERLFADPDPESDGSLQLMTIHKSKGLQFETVIVPGLGREPAHDERPLVLWTDVPGPAGEPELLMAPVEPDDEDGDPVYTYLRHLERRKAGYESVRLLYVAATRARERLHLLGHTTVRDREIQRPRPASLLHLLWPVVRAEFQRAYDSGQPVAERERPVLRGIELRRLPANWLVRQPPPLDPSPEEIRKPVRFDWVGDTLRHVGTVVHSWLQRFSQMGLDHWTVERIVDLRPAIQTALEALGVPPGEIAEAVRLVTQALAGALSDARGRWILTRREIDGCEFAAGISMDGAIHHVVIDRTFVEDGTRWIIDYKSSSHEGSNLEEFLDDEQLRYRDQLDRYARLFGQVEGRPVRLGLYFPLLGGWREWPSETRVFEMNPAE